MFPLLLRHTSHLSVLFLGFAAGAEAANEYRLDDGVKELGIGLQPSRQYSLAWLNRFVIRSGYETITAVNVAFGGSLLASNIPNGTPVAVHVWLDSNFDGLPDHDPVLATATGFVANSGTNTFNSYALLQPLTFQAGDIIFAGAIVAYTGMPQVAAIDTGGTDEPPTYPPNDHSFIAANWATPPAPLTPIDPNHLAWADLPVATVRAALFGGTSDGNWMIRLDATGTPGTPLPVVSPTTLDLGSVDPGSSASGIVSLFNAGTAAWHIQLYAPTPSPMPPAFQVLDGTCGPVPHQLAPGAGCNLDVVFAPVGYGSHSVLVEVTGNTPPGSAVFALKGQGGLFADGFE